MDFKDSFNSFTNKKQRSEDKKVNLSSKTPAAPRAPMEYERRNLIIPRRPLWF